MRVLAPHECPAPDHYDAFVTVLGFEARSLHAARKHAETASFRFAIVFGERTVLDYERNKTWLSDNDFKLCLNSRTLTDEIMIALGQKSSARIAIDISSMSRTMIAELVSSLAKANQSFVADFLYSPAKFTSPLPLGAPQVYSGPVSPEYAGWTDSPELPLAAVIGLGYERGRALGVLEYLEPAVAWIFSPTVREGIEDQSKFDEAIVATNQELAELVPRSQYISYDVSSPFQYFESLESLVYGLRHRARVLLAPFGPKIFALVSILVAEVHRPFVTVWRVSGGQSEQADVHPAAGPIYRLSVAFGGAASL